MTEFEIFALSSMNSSSTGAYQIAMAFSIWVAFRAANLTGQQYADNIIAKTAATVFGLATLFYFNMTYAFWSFNQAATSYRLAELKESGGDISSMASAFVTQTGATTTPPTFSLVPGDPIIIALELAILTMILYPIWGPKK
ncbi:MAG: hypothetical protein ACPHS9_05945 [Parvibaculales bacterium]|jgi:hypothetical protein|nr:hypothetical protein [Alphaproteobacteria bacterium]